MFEKKYEKLEIDYENKIAKDYNQWYHQTPIERYYDHDFVKFANKYLKNGDRILDLGCGPASLWPELKKIRKIKLEGVDISPAMIEEARKKYPRAKFGVASSEKLPFKNEVFDTVICSSILHHLPRPEPSFEEIKRVLKPGGFVIGREPQDESFLLQINSIVNKFLWLLIDLVYAKEKTVIQTEPKMHQFHKPYKLSHFARKLQRYLKIIRIENKYPFSSLFTKMKSRREIELVIKSDDILDQFNGNQFFYVAKKSKNQRNYIANKLKPKLSLGFWILYFKLLFSYLLK